LNLGFVSDFEFRASRFDFGSHCQSIYVDLLSFGGRERRKLPFVCSTLIAYVLQGCGSAGPASGRGRRAEEIEPLREG
jgi:hypothetical protein